MRSGGYQLQKGFQLLGTHWLISFMNLILRKKCKKDENTSSALFVLSSACENLDDWSQSLNRKGNDGLER